ncbi:MAG: Isoleucine-tRNA ligase [candidate division TM6 bacterium GW2011_GWE2_42_60]|nr:MAG: Isoleucine-tRNA ligase [candidate division TM6 bacterium GW2011_GWE2_42_60]HBY06194.1 isoleucine--tRNA ligase [Candidatus Dependentiae bacterium]
MADERTTGGESAQGGVFKETLNLPRTDFPLRADSKINDPLMLARWQEELVAQKAMQCNEAGEPFILHDGPPYANGPIHLGHAYNKILKDIITKARRMMGHRVPVVPGWDCHGLPIEHKVSGDNPGLSGAALKTACREYAAHWVNFQRDEFKKLGILMDWDHPYITMDPHYEASILRAFAQMVRAGFIERKNKTVPWCATCKTTLATAEIEYQDRTDPSLYVLFEVEQKDAQRIFPASKNPLFLVIWTTTPWTIPLNRAVWLKNGAAYQRITVEGRDMVVAESLAPAFIAQLCGRESCAAQMGETVPAELFENVQIRHPFDTTRLVPVILEPSVSLEEGTACVHCAPGCGPQDYEVAVKHGLEIYSPLSADGCYTKGIVPQDLEGQTIAYGQEWVKKQLRVGEKLVFEGKIQHSYPHCWRCRQGLMFRATPQWFCNLNHNKAKEQARAATEQMTFYPAQSRNFLKATLENRWEWCLSRQKTWGVPIPALIEVNGTDVFIDPAFIEKVADAVAQEGIEFWDRVTVEDLAKRAFFSPEEAKKYATASYRKERDILDVWFDSGVSHAAVLMTRPELAYPADLYLEGLDQHRGWFQSSLLTGIMLNQKAPMKAIMTHGFTVDERGRKMSKSLGNVVAPGQVVDMVGTDGLRLWVASIGIDGDAVYSDRLIQNVGQVYRKIRNTCRFLLQNLYDFDHSKDAVALEKLEPLDRYALHQIVLLQKRVIQAYEQGSVTTVYQLLNEYCATEVSAFYGDVVKDRLYCEKKTGHVRRSVQTAFWHILDTLTRLMAPIMSFAAEQVADFYQGAPGTHPSIHLQRFADLSALEHLFDAVDLRAYDAEWQLLKEMRSAVLKGIEEQRAQGVVKHPLEASVTLSYGALSSLTVVGDLASLLPLLLIVSDVTVVDKDTPGLQETAVKGLLIKVERAHGTKCPRCWQFDTQAAASGLCRRCVRVLE